MLKDCRIGLFLGALLFALAGCADKKDGSASCMNQLNAEQYQSVAENTNCSDYERASGFLGLAGMSFSNFLKKGASDNLTEVLNISKLDNTTDYTKGNRNYITKALCLSGSDNLTNSSRCSGQTKRADEYKDKIVGLSMFGLIGDFVHLVFGILDNDSNGIITNSESSSFTNLDNTTSANTKISFDNTTYELITSSNSYIATDDFISSTTTSRCVEYTDNFTIDNSTIASAASDNCTSLSFLANLTEIRPIYRVSSITDITGGGLSDNITSMVSEMNALASNLDTAFNALEISETNSIRKSLAEAMGKLDNGGLDSNGDICSVAQIFDTVALLVRDAADNETSSSELKTKNLVNLNDFINSVNDNATIPPFSGATVDSARLIWNTVSASNETSWSDFYSDAYPGLKNAVTNIREYGTTISEKSDGKIVFRELLCIGEN